MFVLFVLVGVVTSVVADITGQHPHSGTCLCVTGNNVNARTTASIHGAIHATLNHGDCFKLHGGILTKDGYTWYQLQHVHGSENLWVAGTLLNTASASSCSVSSTGSCSTKTKDYACRILAMHEAGRIHLWNMHPSRQVDNAYALNNIKDACNGGKASRSHYTCSECRSPGAPGGTVCLSETLLKYIYDLGSKGYIHVNEIAGACHSCHSYHYRGQAVDLDVGSRNSEFMSLCRSMGGWPNDEINHIHCQFEH